MTTKIDIDAIDYRLAPLRGLPGTSSIDRGGKDSATITGVRLMQVGPLNDSRPLYVDETTLQQAADLMAPMERGLKSRFTHPTLSNDGLGSYLGRFHNPRLTADGEALEADLRISQRAFSSPRGDIGNYVLDLAAEEPDVFGVSFDPKFDLAAMEAEQQQDGTQPIRLAGLNAADVVDSPAATRGGIFGDAALSLMTAPHQLAGALDQLFPEASAEEIRKRCESYLSQYLSTRYGVDQMAEGTTNDNAGDAVKAPTLEQFESLSGTVENLSKSVTKLTELLTPTAGEPEGDDAGDLQAQLLAERKRVTDLHALAELSNVTDPVTVNKWIEGGLSVVEAKAAIHDIRLGQSGLTNDSGEGDGDKDAKYRKEYRDNLRDFQLMGTSEEDYIASRRIDDGKEMLQQIQFG